MISIIIVSYNTKVLLKNCIDSIISHTTMTYIANNPDVGIVGPKIVNTEKRPSRSYMRFLDVKFLFLGSKYLSWLIDTEKYRLHYDNYDFATTQSVPWLSGACLMTSRHVFQEAGYFDEHYFLYLEDMDLCMQVKKNGYSNIYLPSAEIIHFFGGSSEPKKSELKRIYGESAKHYFRKNFSTIEYWLAKIYFSIGYH